MADQAEGTNQGHRKVWTTLITNIEYLPGLLTLDYSLKQVQSKYPLIALYTSGFPEEGQRELTACAIPAQEIPYLLPSVPKEYTQDPRFYDCWSKLAPFSLTEYERVVQLDSDMMVLRNMDELMDVELDPAEQNGNGQRVFAASHACACNPLKKAHYPVNWTPENCAFTTQHNEPELAQTTGPSASAGISSPNGGLVVVVPSRGTYDKIAQALKDGDKTASYEFADQALLGDVFHDRWVPLPYVYNALKTIRWFGVHSEIWRDDRVKNIHYILSPKPWNEKAEDAVEETHQWWHETNSRREIQEGQVVQNGSRLPSST